MHTNILRGGICLIILLLSGCGVRATTTSPTQTIDASNSTPTELPVSETVVDDDPTETIPTSPTQQEDVRDVIIDADTVDIDSVPINVNNVEDLWTPTEDDVLQLEAGLSTYLQQNAEPEHKRIWQELADYKRQYVGIVQDGQDKIHTSFFCDSINFDTTRMTIAGGGDCYFQVIYNVEEDLFSYLNVHGES